MKTSSDFNDLLNLFGENNVRYLVVGGYAVMYHAEPRYTKDLDLWVSPEKDNARAVFKALEEFGAPLAQVTEDDFTDQEIVYQMGIPPVRIDVLMSIDGLDFETAWTRRVEARWGGETVCVISLEDLIANKRATGRPQDLLDVQVLEENLLKRSSAG